ncbi:hypothetical protein MWH25_08330 [Natroniella acetigena]|uniref:hypothetical protein n=1 Tax=Natroniella acetigena TaxID=52004 RepID=UPI00200AEC74|nr:hypothetical protein [Natroniella acetigena]MCK8827745.1 hypothetical protein [Natroniella acetigena]
MIVIVTACLGSENEFGVSKEYSDDYFSLNYPSDWEKEVKGSGANKVILWEEEGLDFQFIVDVRETKDGEVKENPWEKTIKKTEKFKTINIIEQGQVEIDSEKGEKLELKIKTPDGQIENLYYQLKELRGSYKQIDQYLKKVGSVSNFIKEVKNEVTKLDKIEVMLPNVDTDAHTIEPKYKEEIFTLGVIEGVKYELEASEEKILKEKYIVVNKQDIQLQIFFSSNQVEYDNKIEVIQKVINTIRLVD